MREPAEPWVIALNAQYQKVLNILITLSTAAMVLPVFFLRDLLGTPTEGGSYYELLRDPSFIGIPVVYWSWFCFSCSIFAGVLFYYVSATRIKEAWGVRDNTLFMRKISGRKTVQYWLFATFDAAVALFFAGLITFLCFAVAVVGRASGHVP